MVNVKIDQRLLKNMYDTRRGISSRGRVFYPRKARTCANCLFLDYDLFNMRPKGCSLFSSQGCKPEGICIPVRDDSGMSEIHADNISTWVFSYLTLR